MIYLINYVMRIIIIMMIKTIKILTLNIKEMRYNISNSRINKNNNYYKTNNINKNKLKKKFVSMNLL